MKEIYEKPEMMIIRFEAQDIITTSGIGNSTINIRLNNPPSFNLYRIVNR